MTHTGIICEYNPLHAGHIRLLRAVRQSQTVVCLMSGNFTQRGEAAVLPPSVRADMAIRAGADLVLELPYPFSAASARYFATAGIRALSALCVDTVAFGSECGDTERLSRLSEKIGEASFAQNARARGNVGSAKAYFEALGAVPASNDILALEYLRAIREEAPELTAFSVARAGAGYRETVWENGQAPSAAALRGKLFAGEEIAGDLPEEVRDIFIEAVRAVPPARTDRLGSAMLARLRAPAPGDEKAAECGGGLLRHLQSAAARAVDYGSLCVAAATKRYTDARIRRALLFLISGVCTRDLTAPPVYLRLLAANERGRDFLSRTRRTRLIPVIACQAGAVSLGAQAGRARVLSAVSDGLYSICLDGKMAPAELQTTGPVFSDNGKKH